MIGGLGDNIFAKELGDRLASALENGFTAASMVNDAPVVFDDPGVEDTWRPENYTGRYYGPTRLREALTHSRNLVSIRLMNSIGVEPVIEHLAHFGFDTAALPHSLSLALGTGAMSPFKLAAAYCVFANGGYLVEPFLIERIETLDGRLLFQATPATVCRECEMSAGTDVAGEVNAAAPADTAGPGDAAASVLASADGSAGMVPTGVAAGPAPMPVPAAPVGPGGLPVAPRTVNAENIWIMNSMTRDVIRFGTGRRALVLNRSDLSGKTGTTNDQRDAWFAGYNPAIAAVAWVGFDKFDPLGGMETGSRAALPMWIDFMRIALQDQPEQILPRPPGLVNVRIDPATGNLAGAGSSGAIFEVFKAGTVPAGLAVDGGVVPAGNATVEDESAEQLF